MTKGERTAQRILDVAERLFAENGFDGTSLRDIAQIAEIQEPGLYRYFPNKEALYQRVLERCLQPILALLEQLNESDLGLNSPTVLTPDIIEVVVDMLAEHPHISFLFQQAVMAGANAHTETNFWLNTLLEKGKSLISSESSPLESEDEDMVILRLVALFNLCTGYFASASIIQGFLGKSPNDPELMIKQKALLVNIGHAWLKGNNS